MKLLIGIISLLLVTSSFASDKPSFDNGRLAIPSVDSEGKSGFYQNVVFQVSDEGSWELQDVKIGTQIKSQTRVNNSGALEIEYGIQNVELIKIDSFPIQILLKIDGEFTSGCQEVGQIHHQFKDNKFNIFVYYSNDDKFSSGEYVCTAGFVSFEKIIALPVYDLKAGEYEVSVNGIFPRTFNLDADNAL